MSIRDTYAELITERILREILSEGVAPTADEIETRFNAYEAAHDLNTPVFESKTFEVAKEENASVSKYNSANSAISDDLFVLYRHLLKISDRSINDFYRWRTEASLLEAKVSRLQARIQNLLLLNSDTTGYFNFVQDNLSDNSLVDLSLTDASVDPSRGVVSIGTSSIGSTKIDLSSLENKDVVFSVLTKKNLISTIASNLSKRKYVVSDQTNFWQEKAVYSKNDIVTAELRIDLGETKTISRIEIDLHLSNTSSAVQVTPLYSSDNYSWNQLPVTNFTRSIVDKSSFRFAPLEARYFKFIMTKRGYDQIDNKLYVYEFGVDEIAFYNEAIEPNIESTFISKPLFVTGTDGEPENFSRVALEVCEDVPESTSIDYYILVSNDPTVPITASGFIDIEPLNREELTNPAVIDFSELNVLTIEDVTISYDPLESDTTLVNPDADFRIATSSSPGVVINYPARASESRYSFNNSNDRILNHCVASGLVIANGKLDIYRNVNKKGSTTKVRGISNGWRFEDPYYKTTVLVEASEGYTIAFGKSPIIIDEEIRNDIVTIPQGKHTVWVHKDNWVEVAAANSLSELKTNDPIYPFNHRYLVEGFNYPISWTEEKVYYGFDIVAEYIMKEVSLFDMNHNIKADDYSRFAKDIDGPDANRLINGVAADSTLQGSNTCFLVKVNENNSDFLNEKFTIRFTAANSQYKYMRFKAVLKTEVSGITPILDAYKLKVTSGGGA